MLGRLIRQSGVYTLAGVVGKLAGFVLTAFYVDTAILPQADYGYFGVLRATMMIALLVGGAGLSLSILRFATARTVAAADRGAVATTGLVMAVVFGGITACAIWLAAPALAGLLALDPSRDAPVRLVALYVFFKTVADVAYTELRRREAAGLYVAVTAAEMLLLLGCVFFFLVVEGQGLMGVLRGYVASAAVASVALTAGLLRAVERRVAWRLVRPMLAFGLPLIVSGLASRFLYFGDRFLITHLVGLEANAPYELAAQFGGLVHAFLVQGFQLSFTVLGMRALDESGSASLHRRAFRHFAALAGGVVLGLGLFSSRVVALVADNPDYLAIDGLVVLIAGGFAMYGLYTVSVNVLYTAGRTQAVAVGVGAAALLNLGLNLVLIPRVGLAGAAWATLAAYAMLAVWTGVVAERIERAGYPWRAVAVVALLVGGLWTAGQALAGVLSSWAAVAAHAGLVGLYAPLLVLGGVYGRADWAAARALWHARRTGRVAARSGEGLD